MSCYQEPNAGEIVCHCELDGAREVWGEGRSLLPERRVILPIAAHVAGQVERLAIDIDETGHR